MRLKLSKYIFKKQDGFQVGRINCLIKDSNRFEESMCHSKRGSWFTGIHKKGESETQICALLIQVVLRREGV